MVNGYVDVQMGEGIEKYRKDLTDSVSGVLTGIFNDYGEQRMHNGGRRNSGSLQLQQQIRDDTSMHSENVARASIALENAGQRQNHSEGRQDV